MRRSLPGGEERQNRSTEKVKQNQKARRREGGGAEESSAVLLISSEPSILEYINTYIVIFMPHYQSYTFTTAPGLGMNVSPGKTKVRIKHGYAVNVNI